MNAKYIQDLEEDLGDYQEEIVEQDEFLESSDSPFFFQFDEEFIDITEERQRELLEGE